MGTFSAVGVSADFFVVPGNTLRVTITNTFVATVVIERKISGGYVPIFTITGDQAVALPTDGTFRLNCTAYTSGTVTYALASVAPANPYLPPGGTMGQALEKTSNAPGVADWRTISASVPVGNVAFVDAVNGNNATGAVGDQALPFLTIQAAITASASGNTVVIWPGAYAGADAILKNGVNLHFLAGARPVPTDTGTLFTDNAVAVTCAITGDASFDNAFTTGTLLALSGANSSVLLECRRIAYTPTAFQIGATCSLVAVGKQSIIAGQVLVDTGSTGATRVSISAPTITATSGAAFGISASNGAVGAIYDIACEDLTANVLNNATAGSMIRLRTSSHRANLDAPTIDAKAGSLTYAWGGVTTARAGYTCPVVLEGAAEVHLMEGRFIGNATDVDGRCVGFYQDGGNLRLYPGTVLIAGALASETIGFISTPGTPGDVLAMGAIAANKGAAVGVTVAVGSLLVDAAVV